MQLVFTRAEIEQIILDFANDLVPNMAFNKVSGEYSHIPASVTVECEDAAQ